MFRDRLRNLVQFAWNAGAFRHANSWLEHNKVSKECVANTEGDGDSNTIVCSPRNRLVPFSIESADDIPLRMRSLGTTFHRCDQIIEGSNLVSRRAFRSPPRILRLKRGAKFRQIGGGRTPEMQEGGKRISDCGLRWAGRVCAPILSGSNLDDSSSFE